MSKNIVLQMIMNVSRFLFALIVMILLTPFIIDSLGMEDFGLWCLVFSIISMFTLLDFGLGTAVVKTVASSSQITVQQRNNKLSTYFILYMLIAIFSSLILLIISFNIEKLFSLDEIQISNAKILIWILLIRSIVFALPLGMFRSVLFGSGHINEIAFIQIGTTIIYAILTVIFLSNGLGIVYLAIANLIAGIIESFLFYMIATKTIAGLKLNLLKFRLLYVKEIASLSAAAIIIQTAGMIMLKSDPVIIKFFLSLTAVSLYSVALKIAENFHILMKQISHVIAPRICKLWSLSSYAEVNNLYLNGTKHIFAIALIGAAIISLNATFILQLWLGDEFIAAAPILIILVCSTAILAPQLIAGDLLVMSGHHKTNAIAATISVVTNLIISVLLIQNIGIIGVALGTLFSTLLIDLMLITYTARKIIKIKITKLISTAFLPACVPVIAYLIFNIGLTEFMDQENAMTIILANISAILFSIISYWIVTMNKQDKTFITETISKLFTIFNRNHIAIDSIKA
jgi:O-antigen/teichoic acid export membrane protein